MNRVFVVIFFFLSCSLFSVERETAVLDQARRFFSVFEEKGVAYEKDQELVQLVNLMMKSLPERPSGQYLALLGDGQYYLGNFGNALYFWKRASLLLPESDGLVKRIDLARALLDLDRPPLKRPFVDFVGCTFLPMTMKYLLILSSCLVAFFFWSLWVLLRLRAFRFLFWIFAFTSCTLLGAVTWYEWFAPPHVMILRATELRGSLDFTPSGLRPTYYLKTGEEAEVLSSSPDKKWLRIRTVNNQTGYVHGNAVGFLE